MGIIYTTIKIRNPLTESEFIELNGKVDTGATLLVLPGDVAKKFSFPKIRREIVKYANEETAERDIVWGVELEICGRKGMFEAIVEPRSLAIYPNPRSDLPMAEIE
ncbi:MAG TPA: hypothetical protein ENI73_01760 [Spirochaetes bacterium]|nr:hypothetical protein [Spirochaetota bacterium]